MVKVNVQPNKGSKMKGIIIGILIAGIVVLFVNYIKSSSSKSTNSSEVPSEVQTIFDKEINLRTYNDWKQIAHYRALEYEKCMKDSELSDMDVHEYCAIEYNNSWVYFRNDLEEKADLSYEKIQELEDYWSKTRSEITEKVSKRLELKDQNKRPNYYN
jgi:hypothetical protein